MWVYERRIDLVPGNSSRSIEVEFELSAAQFELMGYPNLSQGQPLSLVLDAGVLLPDPAADSWFMVQPESLPTQLVHVGPALYAFSGQIRDAELLQDEDNEMAILLVNCGGVLVRMTCAPGEDGHLPFGTWETRYLAGVGRLQGVVEEDYSSILGENIGATLWSFRRLILTPGDPLFGQWRETSNLPATPFRFDRILIQARLHRQGV